MNNEWIPVSERLPEKDGLYLVSRHFDKSKVFINICKFKSIENNFYLLSDFDPVTDGVLAWMELPTPYEKPTREIEVIFEVTNEYTNQNIANILYSQFGGVMDKIKIVSIDDQKYEYPDFLGL